MAFLHKRVEDGSGTFGSHLRDLRELQGCSLEQAAQDTKIRESILRAFEEDRIAELDDPVFATRHLKTYVSYLGGHEPYFTARYRERLNALKAERHVRDLLPRMRGVRQWDLFAGPQLLAIAGVLALGALFGGYVLWQAHLVRIPPPLEITSPLEGERRSDPSVTVRGTTMPEAYVTVNGRDAAVEMDGRFALTLDLRRGTTPITIIARRRRGSETQVTRNVVYDVALPNGVPIAPIEAATSSATGTQ